MIDKDDNIDNDMVFQQQLVGIGNMGLNVVNSRDPAKVVELARVEIPMEDDLQQKLFALETLGHKHDNTKARQRTDEDLADREIKKFKSEAVENEEIESGPVCPVSFIEPDSLCRVPSECSVRPRAGARGPYDWHTDYSGAGRTSCTTTVR
eukprot:16446583-Heterocapsa_arctica.AAC.1